MEFNSEGGLELLSRFSERPRSINLDSVLFPADIDSKSVVEIVGESSTGKTLLLYQFIARCILPSRYKEIAINGCNACAILIDLLGHVQVSKIVELMTSAVRDAYRLAGAQITTETIASIVQASLEDLTVIRCCSNDQLQLTLYTLEEELLSNNRIALLAIDNILAHYWQARKDKGLISMDYYSKELLKIVRSQTSRFHTATVYTKWGDVPKNRPQAKHDKLGDTSYRLQLSKSSEVHKFICHIESANNVKQIRYTISDSGIKWIL
ncbi:hypothetical protein PUN28_005549 [Cardiocondyla obscurior]|uniref:Rad51-like C-terminal domain-containing protein n=1 Tax=Cardiocondyla obscurior TaxID=286306 RepID=A0AAW2GIC0_9HYME